MDPILIKKPLNGKCISAKKQITFILTQNGIAIPVHFKFFKDVHYTDIHWYNKLNFLTTFLYPYEKFYLKVKQLLWPLNSYLYPISQNQS